MLSPGHTLATRAVTLFFLCSTEPSPAYYEFVGVRSCQDVIHLYRLLWVSTVLNVLGLCLGIVTAAVLGAFKDMVSSTILSVSSQ